MISAGIGLGTGIVEYVSLSFADQPIPLEGMLQSIADFGISVDDVKKLEPTCKELFELYSAVKAYRVTVTYLRKHKTKSRLGLWQNSPFA
jgi:hypothetical protein